MSDFGESWALTSEASRSVLGIAEVDVQAGGAATTNPVAIVAAGAAVYSVVEVSENAAELLGDVAATVEAATFAGDRRKVGRHQTTPPKWR
nr:hypothetical protein [Haloprofundus halobius]